MSGWYPDPTGRFEYRYHNDQVWTADVASAGRRYVDPLHLATGQPQGSGRNGLAVAGMVCGIVAVATAWVPFVVVFGLITAIVGLALSIPALARSRATGARRGFAVAGIVTSSCALALGAVGIVLTVVVTRAVERYEEPGANRARLLECSRQEGGQIVARGEIENLTDEERTYSVIVLFGTRSRDAVLVEDVAPGGTMEFTAGGDVGRSDAAGEPDCEIESVNGPPPFGLDPELFE